MTAPDDQKAADDQTEGQKLARRTREMQGLPQTISDPEAIRAVVALLVREPEVVPK